MKPDAALSDCPALKVIALCPERGGDKLPPLQEEEHSFIFWRHTLRKISHFQEIWVKSIFKLQFFCISKNEYFP